MQATKTEIKSYPAPLQLAKASDLTGPEIKAVTDAMNHLSLIPLRFT